MALPVPRRLPGVRFEAAPPLPEEVLPRMDIAGFAGFAAAGPIDVPVAVEDAAEFTAIFGDDAPLAADEARGEAVVAQLAPAVLAFFANGGRRCWVVRVAGDTAESNVFELPGIARVGADGEIGPATLLARSPGSWSDALRVTTAVRVRPVHVQAVDAVAGTLEPHPADADVLRVGDVVRQGFTGSPLTLLSVVDDVTAEASSPQEPRTVVHARAQRWWIAPGTLPVGLAGLVRFLGDGAVEHELDARVAGSAADGELRLALAATPAQAPRAGALVRASFGAQHAYLHARTIAAADGGVLLTGAACTISTAVPPSLPEPHDVVERLELEVRVSDGVGSRSTLTVGLSPRHPRFAAALPDDGRRYGVPERPADLEAIAFAGHFDLAGTGGADQCLLPLAAAEPPLGALHSAGLARDRDGLERLDLGLFVDAALAEVGVARLIEEADWIRDRRPVPRALRGVHALLANDEVTLVAVPDAAQRGWVRARIGRAREPEPPPAVAEPDWSRFLDCSTHVPSAPRLSQAGDENTGAFTLFWTPTDMADADYELQESTDAAMTEAETLYRGRERSFALYGRPRGSILYYQVRALLGAQASGWSNRVRVRPEALAGWELEDPESYDPGPLLDLQLALLRMCAARGDLFCVLDLPEHYREREAIAHAAALEERSRATADVREPDPLRSYGALYHPWLRATAPERPATLRRQPPDGAIAGVIAARSAERGAWIAPANDALRDVLALTPAIGEGAHQALQDARINLVRHEPGGFLCLCADTLEGGEELRPIGVRRLLQTLRRLALRHGATLAFEPNVELTRRAVRRSFEELLERMFELGAFAGTRAGDGFQVSTPVAEGDEDEGRLVVELRVAPARPLEFLTVRLVRTGAGRLSVEVQGT